jgi:hypothetical protein
MKNNTNTDNQDQKEEWGEETEPRYIVFNKWQMKNKELVQQFKLGGYKVIEAKTITRENRKDK